MGGSPRGPDSWEPRRRGQRWVPGCRKQVVKVVWKARLRGAGTTQGPFQIQSPSMPLRMECPSGCPLLPEHSLLWCSCPEPEGTPLVKRIWLQRQQFDFPEVKCLPFESLGEPSQIHHLCGNWQGLCTYVKGRRLPTAILLLWNNHLKFLSHDLREHTFLITRDNLEDAVARRWLYPSAGWRPYSRGGQGMDSGLQGKTAGRCDCGGDSGAEGRSLEPVSQTLSLVVPREK